FVEALSDGDDGLVVLQQQLIRQLGPLLHRQVQAERVMETVDVVLVQPLQRFVLQVLGQLVEALDAEQAEQPLVEDQLPVERQRSASVGRATTARARRGSGVLAGTSARHQTPSVSNISRKKSSSMRRTFQVSSGALRFSRLLSPFT